MFHLRRINDGIKVIYLIVLQHQQLAKYKIYPITALIPTNVAAT